MLDAAFSARTTTYAVRVFFRRPLLRGTGQRVVGQGDSRATAAAMRTAKVSPPCVPNLSGRWAYSSFLIADDSSREGGP